MQAVLQRPQRLPWQHHPPCPAQSFQQTIRQQVLKSHPYRRQP